jgi:hypothetical protein
MARRIGLVGLAGGVVGLTAEWVGFGWSDPRHWIPDLAVGWTYIGCGLVASRRRQGSRPGSLIVATGSTWFVGNFASISVAAVAWLAAHAVYLHRGPLVQLVLTYPSGRPGSRLIRGDFVCAEALTNTAKHAAAARVTVAVTASEGRVRVEVADDGVGGADPARGSGLRGLTDRVETIGGTLQVDSVPGRGTRLAAEIPLGGQAR